MSKVGFVGLGNMGAPMAINLMQAGHELICFDVMSDATVSAQKAGLTIAANIVDVANETDIVVLMLPNGAIVSDVARKILPHLAAGGLLIDCSTIDVTAARDLHVLTEQTGVLCLDAPVSGGVGGAAAGTLTFMVGGSEAAFEIGASLFEIMGQKAVHCGAGGAGQAAKICNNMLLGISMIGTCEAFSLAEKLGLSQSALFDVVSTSSGSCWSVNTYCPVPGVGPQSPSDNNYAPGFAAALMLKDLRLAMEAAHSSVSQTPLGEHAHQLYQKMVSDGMGGKDFSAMIEFLANSKDP
ncbi:MAG: 3-hydroxyisobutyrate dehydrogenase [Hyphomicrobiales bacterium]